MQVLLESTEGDLQASHVVESLQLAQLAKQFKHFPSLMYFPSGQPIRHVVTSRLYPVLHP